MPTVPTLDFYQERLMEDLPSLSSAELDGLEFGVIGFDGEGLVRVYSEVESKLAGLSPSRVLGSPLFTVVAPCMNNFMVALRFEKAAENGTALDVTVDYVLTLRMRPLKVKLRLLSAPNTALRYLLVLRNE